ncbi:hypothetical protein FB561_4036 [Kribbella amoyensis]|uniref:Uncharacterized protein n=1 Tax=Kribbella amoyensis TaxID=996641 RepID=A0A561BVI5_9ACTN|nr:hypothetical protein [Kribbella amoyensis]TWD82890.1 hypothetical protein FB561_4036 [Kribbella amoyensis]
MSSDWYTEYRQNKQLDQLRGEMESAAWETSSLRSRLSQLQGSFETRLERLSAAFDAYVELSDIRHEMAGFLDAAEVRRYAGQVLTALASDTALPRPVDDVPGYWLRPAVDALIALSGKGVQDGPAEAPASTEGPLAEALRVDERRTSVFLSLALATLGLRHQVRTEWLDTAFGVPAADGTITRLQRVLWITGARGGFGAEGLALVVKRLQSVAPMQADWAMRIESRGTANSVPRTRFEEVADQVEAAIRVSRIRSAVETVTGNTEALEPARDLADAEAEKPDEYSASALLRLLISEGSEPERESLARVALLRAQITGDGKAGAGTIGDPAAQVEQLLREDLQNGKEPHLAIAALRVVAPSVLPGVEKVAATASRPSPAEVVLAANSAKVTIRPDGPDALMLSQAEAAIVETVGPPAPRDLAGPGVWSAAGLVVAVGLGLVHWFWILVGLVLIGIGVNRYLLVRQENAQAKKAARDQADRLRERCTSAADSLAAYARETDERIANVAADLTEIRRRLTA